MVTLYTRPSEDLGNGFTLRMRRACPELMRLKKVEKSAARMRDGLRNKIDEEI